MLVYMFYHLEKREKKIFDLVSMRIRQLAYDADIRILDFDEGTVKALYEKPDIIITFPTRDDLVVSRLTALKVLLNCKIIVLETEGLINYSDEDATRRRIGFNTYDPQLVDYYFYWGSHPRNIFAELLRKDSKVSSDKRVDYCGYVMYDLALSTQTNIYTQMKTHYYSERSGYKRAVLFLTGFNDVDATDNNAIKRELDSYKEQSTFSMDENGNIRDEDIEWAKNKIIHEALYRDRYIQLIKCYAERNPEVLVWVKTHPMEDLNIDKYKKSFEQNKNISIICEDIPVGVLISLSDILVHYGSTAGLESYIYKKPTLWINGSGSNAGGEMYESTYMYDIDAKETILEFLGETVPFQEKESTRNFLHENFGFDESSSEHLIDRLITRIFEHEQAQKIYKNNNKGALRRSCAMLYYKSVVKDMLQNFKIKNILQEVKVGYYLLKLWV